jgi:hypothetical protein
MGLGEKSVKLTQIDGFVLWLEDRMEIFRDLNQQTSVFQPVMVRT